MIATLAAVVGLVCITIGVTLAAGPAAGFVAAGVALVLAAVDGRR